MSWFGGSLNVSSGGHVYDRTTGTWAGETQGSVGDGVDRSVSSRVSTVWHDANGPVGVSFDRGSGESSGTGSVSRGHVASGPATNPVVAGGSGAGAGTANTSGPGSGGSGPGSGGVVAPAGPLKAKMKNTATQIMFGVPIVPNPWVSNADQGEERWGEPGDWLMGVAVMGADALYNTFRAVDHATGSDTVSNKRRDTFKVEDIAGKGQPYVSAVTDWIDAMNSPFGPDKPIAGIYKGGF
ncbi:hypothetical protein [Tortoise microvirus 73]|nr:hypothetical protein [Tortoise microvirus 73]